MFETLLIQPLYNLFVFLVGILPFGDVGFAILIITLIVRAVFYPVFTASIRTQMGMQAAQGELNTINDKYKDKPEERIRRTQELFKKYNIRPFMGFFALIVQFAVFIALYFALFREGFPEIDTSLLYSFVSVPHAVGTSFLGVLDLLASRDIILAIIVAGSQYLAIRLTLARTNNTPSSAAGQQAAAQAMQQKLMLYFLPALMGVVSYTFPNAVGLYFVASNLISLAQEWWVMHQRKTQN